jgi:hypothetical protein
LNFLGVLPSGVTDGPTGNAEGAHTLPEAN